MTAEWGIKKKLKRYQKKLKKNQKKIKKIKKKLNHQIMACVGET
jgi:Skp family chaperone for outer membrane proteins